MVLVVLDQVQYDGPPCHPALWIPACAGMTVWVTVLLSPSGPVSSTGTGLNPLPSRERGMGGCVVLLSGLLCGYCLKASMTAVQASPLDCGSSPQ